MINNEKSIKSFWKRPEGIPGMIGLGLLGIGALILLKNFLPDIISLMKDTYTAIGLAAGLFVIGVIVTNSRFKTTMWYLYKGLMRGITGFFIELNPIAILESYVEDIREKINGMEKQLEGLKGQIRTIGGKLEAKKTEYSKEMDKAAQAKKMGKSQAEITLYVRQAGRLEEYIKKLDTLHKKMEVIYKVLSKMKDYSVIMVKDTENDVAIRKEEREAITKSHSIMKSAISIIQGNTDKKVIFDQAMEFVVDDIGQKIGEMDRMLEASTDFINSVDLDNAVYEERGLKMLEEFEQKGMDTIFGKQQNLNQGVYSDLSKFVTPTPESVPMNSNNKSSDKKYF